MYRHSTAAVLLAVLLLTGVSPSLAQDERRERLTTVTIQARHILEGIWLLPPHWTTWSPGGWYDWSPEMYCRIGRVGPKLTFDCFGLLSPIGEATVDEDGFVHLRRSLCYFDGCSGYGDWVFRGKLESNIAMSGHIGAVSPNTEEMFAGVLHEQPEVTRITKVLLSEKSPDKGGQAEFLKLLLSEMAAGKVTEPYTRLRLYSSSMAITPIPEESQARLMAFETPERLRPLGKIQSVVYVGEYGPMAGWNRTRSYYIAQRSSVYAVEFERGELLCALHRRPDGVLDQFRCI